MILPEDWRVPLLPPKLHAPPDADHQTPSLTYSLTTTWDSPTQPRRLAAPGRRQNVEKENHRPIRTLSNAPAPNKSRFLTQPPLRTRNSLSRPHDVRSVFWDHTSSPPQFQDESGRFEREFVAVDTIGQGEFGSAIKVRYRHDHEGQVFAVKRSKHFEGNRHRYRLREEVDVLRHLAEKSGPSFHPNILGYVDSWEQDNQLYILTELCEFGNFAHFLTEYGHHFARLDEARVWKIFAHIGSVSVNYFIMATTVGIVASLDIGRSLL